MSVSWFAETLTRSATRLLRRRPAVRSNGAFGRFASAFNLAAAAIALSILAIPLPAQVGTTPTFADVTVHDPSIEQDGSTFYIFGSHLATASTTDFMQWTQISGDFPAGSPPIPNPNSELSEAVAYVGGDYGFWAPDVIKLQDGRYYFYYCIGRLDQPRAALGIAASNAITGPYTHEAILLRSGSSPSADGTPYDANFHPNTIDPTMFYDQDNVLWMVYGSYSGGIFILQMDPMTGHQLPNQGYGTKLIGGYHARIEGPYIIYSPESEYYYLFVSFGGLDANGGYNIRVGRSRDPDGPYLDAAGTDLATVTGTPGQLFDDDAIAPHGVKLMGGHQFQHVTGEPGSTTTGYRSPGHNSAWYDPDTGRYFLIFHTRFEGMGEFHQVRVHQMYLNADDWLVAAPHRFAGETIAPADPVRIPGNYKLINHGKAINATPIPSTNITLHADGSISGSATGAWELTADYNATLTLGGTTYRGVFSDQWNDDKQKWVLTFSALSSDGIAVWGSKVAIDVAPAIVTQPIGRTVLFGNNATFAVTATADPAPTYQWRKDGAAIAGATDRTLAIAGVDLDDAGDYTVAVTNSAGTTVSDTATLTIDNSVRVTAHPTSLTQPAGSAASLTVTATGSAPFSYQWFQDGTPIAGATSATLELPSLSADDAGYYTVDVTDAAGSVTSRFARVVVASPQEGAIVNLSVRSTAGIGGNPLIVGFVAVGGSKDVLVRGIGPRLADFGVGGVLDDPEIDLYSGSTIEAGNDDWGDDALAPALTAVFTATGAFPLPDETSKDAALVATVSGSRTVHVNSTIPGVSGVALMEVYDTEPGVGGRLVNVSARNFAGQGSQTLIAGFYLNGNVPKRVLIRGVGPSLEKFSVPNRLPNPRLEVHTKINDEDVLVATNDDWVTEPDAAAAISAANAFALAEESADAAVVLTLSAGGYTAHVTGADGATGQALVEIYELL